MTERRLHHVAVLSFDADAAVQRLSRLHGTRAVLVREVEMPGVRLRTAMLELDGGTFIQVIQPIEGPGTAELALGGEGALYEYAVAVTDIEDAAREARRQGDVPRSLNGDPLEGDFATAASGSRYFYLDAAAGRGPRLEVIQPAGRGRPA